jgi:hypothetical protein
MPSKGDEQPETGGFVPTLFQALFGRSQHTVRLVNLLPAPMSEEGHG